MVWLPSVTTRTDTLLPDTTRFRSNAHAAATLQCDVGAAVLCVGHFQVGLRHQLLDVAAAHIDAAFGIARRSEEHTSELQSLMRRSYAVLCLKKKKKQTTQL